MQPRPSCMQKECHRSKFSTIFKLGCGLSFGQRSDTSTIHVARLQFSSMRKSFSFIILLLQMGCTGPIPLCDRGLDADSYVQILPLPSTVLPGTDTHPIIGCSIKECIAPLSLLLGCSNCGSISSRYYPPNTIGLLGVFISSAV